MRVGFILVAGVFFNLFMAVIFPFQLLDIDTAQSLMGSDTIGYDFDNNPYFGDDYKDYIDDFKSTQNAKELESTTNLEQGSTILSSIGNFFDGLTDALNKAKTLLIFIIPFVTIFFLMPGAFGLIIGYLYSIIFSYAVIRFIRGA